MRLVRIDERVRPKNKRRNRVTDILLGILLVFGVSLYILSDKITPQEATTPNAQVEEYTEIVRQIPTDDILRHQQNTEPSFGKSVSYTTTIPKEPQVKPTNPPKVSLNSRGMESGERNDIPYTVGKKNEMTMEVFDALYAVGKKNGLPVKVWFPIAMCESRGNPKADTGAKATEHSHGIFQVNLYWHPKAHPQKLFDPTYNANYYMPTLADTYRRGQAKGIKGVDLTIYVERYGEKPLWTPENSAKIIKTIKYYYSKCP
jgi:hypothetical protein